MPDKVGTISQIVENNKQNILPKIKLENKFVGKQYNGYLSRLKKIEGHNDMSSIIDLNEKLNGFIEKSLETDNYVAIIKKIREQIQALDKIKLVKEQKKQKVIKQSTNTRQNDPVLPKVKPIKKQKPQTNQNLVDSIESIRLLGSIDEKYKQALASANAIDTNSMISTIQDKFNEYTEVFGDKVGLNEQVDTISLKNMAGSSKQAIIDMIESLYKEASEGNRVNKDLSIIIDGKKIDLDKSFNSVEEKLLFIKESLGILDTLSKDMNKIAGEMTEGILEAAVKLYEKGHNGLVYGVGEVLQLEDNIINNQIKSLSAYVIEGTIVTTMTILMLKGIIKGIFKGVFKLIWGTIKFPFKLLGMTGGTVLSKPSSSGEGKTKIDGETEVTSAFEKLDIAESKQEKLIEKINERINIYESVEFNEALEKYKKLSKENAKEIKIDVLIEELNDLKSELEKVEGDKLIKKIEAYSTKYDSTTIKFRRLYGKIGPKIDLGINAVIKKAERDIRNRPKFNFSHTEVSVSKIYKENMSKLEAEWRDFERIENNYFTESDPTRKAVLSDNLEDIKEKIEATTNNLNEKLEKGEVNHNNMRDWLRKAAKRLVKK